MKLIKTIILLIFPAILFSQETLDGQILEQGSMMPVPGANIYWLNTEVGTITDFNGNFTIPFNKEYNQLVVSFVGYKADTITVKNNNKRIQHQLTPSSDLDQVDLVSRRKPTSRSYLESSNVMNISSDELLKAACCNLSESFETNPSIDVNFADAISGTRQIKMLGLTSPYILIATENIPAVRGAAQAYGLSFTPGTWVESIQITKGAGSVVNGYESIAGQINAELQKPANSDKLFVNLYGATSKRLELNTHYNTQLNKKWSTGIYVHGNSHQEEHDVNNDNFLDMPLYNQINLMNRWQYIDNENGLVAFMNFRYLHDEKQTGELHFEPGMDKLTMNAWGSEINTQRYEFSGKLGYVNPELPWQSVGLQLAVSNHQQDSYFGLRVYDIEHNSIYSNIIYNSILSDSRHKIKTGVDFTQDSYDELVEETDYVRKDNSVGGFFEYNFDDMDKLNLTAGLRADYHNRLGFFLTPRVHARYRPWAKSALRASFGRGKRAANIFAENQNLFASSREIEIMSSTNGDIYGLDPEIAWNYGISYMQGFNFLGRKAEVIFDYYRTDFQNQVVVDWEDPQEIRFYNVEGGSYANSFQVELSYNLAQRLDLRTAYKFYDIKTKYQSGTKLNPLIPEHRIFANLSYETLVQEEKQWKFDATYNWLGEQRFPSTSSNPVEYRTNNFSPSLSTLNAQVTRVFSKQFEVYIGGENMTNVRQDRPIIGAEDPFGQYFDSTLVYGPVFGSMYYAGFRFKLN